MPAPIPHGTAPSTRMALVEVLRAQMAAHPAGLTLPAWRTLAQATLPISAARFGGQVQSLRRTGDVITVGGRVGHQRYAPAGMPIAASPAPDDFVGHVLTALRTAEGLAGHPVHVGRVTEALPSTVVIPHRNAVRAALSMLAAPRRRGPAALQQPVYRRTEAGAAGHRSTVWSTTPIAAAPSAPPSRLEALRRLVVAATADVGIPLPATWIGRWAAANDGYATWPPSWRRGIRRALTDAARRPTSQLEAWQPRWGLVPRFVVTDTVAPEALAAAALEEFAVRTDLVQEQELLTVLAHQSRVHHAKRMRLEARRRLLGALIAEIAGDLPLESILERLRHALAARERLARRPDVAQACRALRAQVDALVALLPTLTIAPWPDRPPVLGEAGLMTPEATERWAAAAVLATEMTLRNAHRVMVGAAGVLVGGEVRIDALRAVAGLLRYTTAPQTNRHVTGLIHDHGMIERAFSAENRVVADYVCAGVWGGALPASTTTQRIRLGALLGALEA